MADAPTHMWSYWRDKHGPVDALEEYYPDVLRSDPQLMTAVVQVKSGLKLIDTIMAEKSTTETD